MTTLNPNPLNPLPQDLSFYPQQAQDRIRQFIDEDEGVRKNELMGMRRALEVPPVLLGMVGDSSGISQAPTIGSF